MVTTKFLEGDEEIRDVFVQKPMPPKFTGWRFGVLACTCFASLIFFINLIFTIVFIAIHGFGQEGRVVLHEGSCNQTKRLNAGVHVFINILSTIILSSSNYCMQCLSSPTRSEINKAHATGRWLDIGVPSIRNLRHIKKKRLVVWCLLALSSLPLHLFYNSAIFSSIAANDAQVLSVNEAFVDPSFVNFTDPYHGGSFEPGNEFPGPTPGKRLRKLALDGSLQNMTVDDCITSYAENFISKRSGVLLVLDTSSDPRKSQEAAILQATVTEREADDCVIQNERFAWVCQQDGISCRDPHHTPCESRLEAIRTNTSGWRPFEKDFPVKYCLSDNVREHCRLQFSSQIGVIVVVLNAFKVILMISIFFISQDVPFMTMGDSVFSFLTQPDSSTEGMSLLSKTDVLNKGRDNWVHDPVFKSTQRLWFAAASKKRWILCISTYIAALAICAGLLGHGLSYISNLSQAKSSPIFSLGLGAINPLTFILWDIPTKGASGLISNVLVANIPQLILSFIYFTYNGLATSMYNAYEWSTYALKAKGLRVSSTPQGQQRSTYFLSLPYRIAIPLMVASGVLHWLISQSIFLIVIERFSYSDGNSRDTDVLAYNSGSDNMTCGWSPEGIVAVIVVGTCLVICLLALGCRSFKTGMPLAGSCSAAISAACHGGHEEEIHMQLKKIQWGVVGGNDSEGKVRRCGFSSKSVEYPQEGAMYY